jgi:hypothetical protein
LETKILEGQERRSVERQLEKSSALFTGMRKVSRAMEKTIKGCESLE